MKLKYLNRAYHKVSSKMYDYNCDVKLVVGTETFKAHRDVLVNASDYFSAMFTHDMRERQDDVIRLQEVSPRGFAAMMEYVALLILCDSCEAMNIEYIFLPPTFGPGTSVGLLLC